MRAAQRPSPRAEARSERHHGFGHAGIPRTQPRLGARVGTAHIAFDDHPSHQRFADRIETVTVDSVFAWLPRVGLAAPPVRLGL